MAWKIKDENKFRNSVFGADSFLEWWPELLTTGVELVKRPSTGHVPADLWYIDDPNASDCSFFTEEEMETLEEV